MISSSIISYPERGIYGDSNYRGNCSGYVIRDLIQHFYGANKPRKFVEVFSGGGTGADVAKALHLENSIHLDLSNGWNALQDDMPSGSDFVFSHPPYWDIIRYEWQRKEAHQDDLSNVMPYDEFISLLDSVNEKIYYSLVNGGRHATLIGDIRKKGQYYSMMKDMTFFGDLEAHMIKEQHHTVSSRKNYGGSFIPIEHEHLLVFKKTKIWHMAIKYTKDFQRSIMQQEAITWRDLVQAALEANQGRATLDTLCEQLQHCKKAKKNQHVRAKLRQVLNEHINFKKEGKEWQLCL
jgi:hypothetical protein